MADQDAQKKPRPTASNGGVFVHPKPRPLPPTTTTTAVSDTFVHPRPLPSAPNFGQASQLRSPLVNVNIFNVPKPNRPRPEHHRDKDVKPRYSSGSDDDGFKDPVEMMNRQLLSQPRPISIHAPVQPPIRAIHKPAQPKFSSLNTPFSRYAEEDSLKRNLESQGMSQRDAALFEDRYGDYTSQTIVDPAKAAKDVKALLEGAFDEEEDKPKGRTRRQRKKLAERIDRLADQMDSAKIDDKTLSQVKKKSSEDGQIEEEVSEAEAEEEAESDEEEEVDDGTREGLAVKLLPHQIDGVKWMIRQEIGTESKKTVTKGGILADDMGLGKTIQTISLILLNGRAKHEKSKLSPGISKTTLVVAPLALIKQWERELEEKVEDTHYMKILVHHGPKRTKRGEDLRKYDVVITTYQTITSEHEASSPKDDGPKVGCFDVQWYRIILDEAHTIKNRNAKCTKGCYDLRSEYRWCLTGTPMQNSLDELHSLICFLRVKSFSQKSVWKEKITDPMTKGKADLAIQRLQAILKSVMKRRTKDVLRKNAELGNSDANTEGFKLVGRKVEVVKVKFSEKEEEFYQQLQSKADRNIERMMTKESLNFAGALALLLRLRQACNHRELVKKELGNDPDDLAVVAKSTKVRASNKPSQSAAEDINDLTNLLGGLEVHEKRCELCGDDLSQEETSSSMLRCVDCQAFIEEDEDEEKNKPQVKKQYRKEPRPKAASRRSQNRPIVLDSDDEEDGDWIVPVKPRAAMSLGKAGGSDDENAEGGGEWLASEDSNTDDDSSIKIVKQKKQVMSLPTTDDSITEYEEDSFLIDEKHHALVASTKINTTIKILRKEASQHKFIIFSEWTSMLNLLEPFLREEGIKYCRYDGKMKNDAREASLEQLRKDKKTRVLLCSLKCGSLGLNLTAASRVIIMEPFWNPFVEEQAIDRVHRLNQTIDVVVYRLTIEGTVEERIFELQNQKRELAEAALEGKAIAKLSMKELLNLFKHDAEHYVQGTKLGDFMLGRATLQEASSSRSGSSTPVLSSTLSMKPRIPQKPKTTSRPEHAIYGRRW